MKRRWFRKGVSCLASAAMAVMMLPAVGGGVQQADAAEQAAWWTSYQPTAAATPDSSYITTYGVRAGSAGGDYLGISNTNFDFRQAGASATTQYDWSANGTTDENLNALAIWGSSANENPNPYIRNLFYKVLNPSLTVSGAATTWSSNEDASITDKSTVVSSWGDSNNVQINSDGDIAGTEYGPDIVFGAAKKSGWTGYSAAGTNLYAALGTSVTYANNDATNIWTQIYTEGQLAQKADAGKTDSESNLNGKKTRYDNNSATTSAVNYEKAIRGNLLYIASCLYNNTAAKKKVAYLYKIENGTATFFTPQASGLTDGDDDGEAVHSSTDYVASGTTATANKDYAANNGTIDLGYMATLPFITDTYTNSNTSTVDLTVEDIVKANPACTLSSSEYSGALSDVDVIIYNSNSSMVSSNDLSTLTSGSGFNGTTIMGDDFGTSKNQTRTSTGTAGGQAPLLYCQRNYTMDKNARAAWAFSQVYPNLYGGNKDASYAYYVNEVLHISLDKVPTVAAWLENNSSTVTYTSATASQMETYFSTGYNWWNSYGRYDETTYRNYDYYNGSCRASFYNSDAGNVPEDTIGIFAPSDLWTASVSSSSSSSLSAMALDSQAEPNVINGVWGGCKWTLTELDGSEEDAKFYENQAPRSPQYAVDIYPVDKEEDAINGCDVGVYPDGMCKGKTNKDFLATAIQDLGAEKTDWWAWLHYGKSNAAGTASLPFATVTTIRVHDGVTSVGQMTGFLSYSNRSYGYDAASCVSLPKSLKYIDLTALFLGAHITDANSKYMAYDQEMTLTIDGVTKEINDGSELTFASGTTAAGLNYYYDTGKASSDSDDYADTKALFKDNEVVVPSVLESTLNAKAFGESTKVSFAPTEDKLATAQTAATEAQAALEQAAKAACEAAGIAYDESLTAAENITAAQKAAADSASTAALEQAAKDACETAGIAYDASLTYAQNAERAQQAVAAASAQKPVAQKVFVKVSKKTYKAKALKKKQASFKIGAQAMTGVSYKVTKGKAKYVKVSKKGKVTVKKGARKGTYKVTVTAKASSAYKAAKATVTVKVK